MTIKKETFNERAAAGRTLVFLAAAMKPFTATQPLGAIGGFSFSLQRLEARTNLLIHGKHTYEANVSDNPLGTISSIEHTLATISERLTERECDLRQCIRQREDLGKMLDQPFEHKEKLAAAVKRQQEIIAALDVTKNQASPKVGDPDSQSQPQKQNGHAITAPGRSKAIHVSV